MSFKLITGSSLISALMLSACGPSQNQVRIAIPFGADDARFALMSQLVKNYNNYINKEEKNAKGYKDGYLPVTMYSSGGYFNNSTTIEKQLQTNDANVPNLSIGYGNNIYTANQNNHRALDFSRSTSQDYPKTKEKAGTSYETDSIPTNTYEQVFTKINDLISGIDKNGLYLIPMGASSELMYWNKPVLNYLLNQAITHKWITIKQADQNWFEQNLGVQNTKTASARQSETTVVNAYTVDKTLADKVAKNYGGMQENNNSSNTHPTEIGVDDFQTYTKLFKLLGTLLTHLTNKKPLFGFVQSNLLELMSFLNKGSDYNQFLFHKKPNSNDYDYSFFHDTPDGKSGTANAPLKTVYDLIQTNLGDHGVWYGTSQGASSTTDFKEGKLAFLLNSNSKYKKLFSSKKDETKTVLKEKDVLVTQEPYYYDNLPQTPSNGSSPKGAFWVQGGSIFGIKSNDPKKDHAARLFVKWLTSEKSNQTFGNDTEAQYNGSDWYALSSGYVPGTTAFWTRKDASKNLALLESINPAAAAAYQIFASAKTLNNVRGDLQSVSNNQTYTWGFKKSHDLIPFFEPVGKLSHQFRVATDSNGKGSVKYPDFKTYWNNLTSDPLINSYIANSSQTKSTPSKTK